MSQKSGPINLPNAEKYVLLSFVADEMKAFVDGSGLADRELACGLTFSFPCRQDGLASAQLHHWTKVRQIMKKKNKISKCLY